MKGEGRTLDFVADPSRWICWAIFCRRLILPHFGEQVKRRTTPRARKGMKERPHTVQTTDFMPVVTTSILQS